MEFDNSSIQFSYRDKEEDIKLSFKLTQELAEFVGILMGDGYIAKYGSNYVIEITGHSIKDKLYHKYIVNLIKSLFSISVCSKVRNDQNTIVTRFKSKNIYYLLRKLGMPTGKKNNMDIPKWILSNNLLSLRFIRGIFDTDGSLILRTRKQNSISIGMKEHKVIFMIKEILEKQGYYCSYYLDKINDKREFVSKNHVIRINRKTQISKFYREIGSSNPYKIDRFKKI